ncbi:uncharacterized protein LOC129921139 [Episyrphus balteatus]|uniref:uncharacterized protein LOC129921139 n=1 Tax=Episyrphus balteatus TaxID=286459 RepID=UPI0024852083|nr:uncharacterized protein LOC129921139 [Episyrphus balteatus]
MLIIGVNKRNHLLLLPWMINNGILLTFKFIFVIVVIKFAVWDVTNGHGSEAFFTIIFVLSILVFFCLVWNAIYSLFQSIRKENEGVTLDTESLVGNSNPSGYELFRNSE